jgi:hypothetical protein
MTKFRTLFLRSFTVTKSSTYRLYSQVVRHYRKLQQFTLECASVTLDGLVVGVLIVTTKISRPLPARF